MKIAVVTDSSSTIYDETEVEGVFKVPCVISDDRDSFLEGLECTTDQIYTMVNQGRMFASSLPPIGLIEELFTRLKAEGYEMIFAVPIGSGLSSSGEAMRTGAATVGIDFDMFDCYSTAKVELELAYAARRLFDEGLSVAEVKEKLEDASTNCGTYVMPIDFKHLLKSGRLTRGGAALAGLLKIRPILYVGWRSKGRLDKLVNTRTFSKMCNELAEIFRKAGVGKGYKIWIYHVWNPSEAKKVVDTLKEKISDAEIMMDNLITTVGIHTGIGALAAQFLKVSGLKSKQ